MYGSPTKYDVTLFQVTLTEAAVDVGWTVDHLVDDALRHVGLTLALCPRVFVANAKPDPFRVR
jgi:hypothetical protein